MEINDKSYILGVWFSDYEIGNIMITAFKTDKEVDEWTAEVRLRLYEDNKTFLSDDRKDFYGRSWPKGTDKEKVIKDCNRLVEIYKGAYKPHLHEYVSVEGDMDKLMEELEKKDWAKIKKLNTDNEEDRKEMEDMGIDIDEIKERRGVEKECADDDLI